MISSEGTMLRLLRKGTVDRPWLYRPVMFILAVAFVVTMGWWGFDESDDRFVIRVENREIPREEYRRTFQSVARFYRDMGQQEVKEETLRQIVKDNIINRELWLIAAKAFGITISVEELRASILKTPGFQRAGRFDPERYKSLLADSHLTPARYEEIQREEMMISGAQALVGGGVTLTPQEAGSARATVTDPKLTPEQRAREEEQAVERSLREKRQRVLESYLQALKAQTRIEVNEHLL
jgi:peptidyl-prolyl cis-trans isomerase D